MTHVQLLTLKLDGITAGDYLAWARDPEPPELGLALCSVAVRGDPLGDTVEALLSWSVPPPDTASAGPAAGLPLTPEVVSVTSQTDEERLSDVLEDGSGSHAPTFSMFALGVPEDEASVATYLDSVERAVLPYRSGDYPNFVEEPADASGFFDADTWARLRQVKALYDPSDLFEGNHHIPPAELS